MIVVLIRSDVEVNGGIVNGLTHGVQPCQCYNATTGLYFKRPVTNETRLKGLKGACRCGVEFENHEFRVELTSEITETRRGDMSLCSTLSQTERISTLGSSCHPDPIMSSCGLNITKHVATQVTSACLDREAAKFLAVRVRVTAAPTIPSSYFY
jgi:hypothetical protein